MYFRYYYAIVECDSVQTASHVYNELQGTELERSANVFDLSFVPADMTFEDDFRYVCLLWNMTNSESDRTAETRPLLPISPLMPVTKVSTS